MSVTIYHNPRCTKSRLTLELLKQNNIEPEVIEYLKTPPDQKTLKNVLGLLGISAWELIRKNEQEFKDLGLAEKQQDEPGLIKAMVEHPKLIERPIVLANGKAAIGRPPELVLEIL